MKGLFTFSRQFFRTFKPNVRDNVTCSRISQMSRMCSTMDVLLMNNLFVHSYPTLEEELEKLANSVLVQCMWERTCLVKVIA